ncbi:spore germination protein [Bacillus sp. JCM 19034]|uniref:spore germination protein n=1 Tax=Bacillus sp. JCM 19034 TaxID=1481928 RepID=UPI0007835C59|nr:spore germination protein [Bacillus sp. JCM 19034]
MNIFKQVMESMRLNKPNESTTPDSILNGEEKVALPETIDETKEMFQTLLGKNFDFYFESFFIHNKIGGVLYFTTMVNLEKISESITDTISMINQFGKNVDTITELGQHFFSSKDCEYLSYKHEVIYYALSGYAILFLGGTKKALAINVLHNAERSIEQSETQTIVRGPQESFIEGISTNICLLRKKVKNKQLIFEKFILGKDTKTTVCMAYLDGVANEDIKKQAKERLQSINISAIFDSANIEELISDKVITPFPTVYHTDRPDTAAANLTEGKIAILCDGSPFVLLIPVVFTDFFQVSEDYYQGFMMSSFLRVLRYVGFLIALLLPSFYIGVTTFHHELIPTNLLISVQAQRQTVPFPAVVEILIMELTFEILREAGVRMPRAVGQTVSIVGALVIGQAAVEAGIVSHILIIIVALTAMASFVIPVYSFANALRLLRFALIIITGIFGLLGTLIAFLMMIVHLTHLRSFGVPYLTPMGPFIIEDQKDIFFRLPIFMYNRRPSYLATNSEVKSTSKKMKKNKGS